MSSVIEPVEGRLRAEWRKGLILLAALVGYQMLLHWAISSDPGSGLGESLTIAPLVVTMFLAEYFYRILRYPNFSHASIRSTIRAFRKYGGSGLAPGR